MAAQTTPEAVRPIDQVLTLRWAVPIGPTTYRTNLLFQDQKLMIPISQDPKTQRDQAAGVLILDPHTGQLLRRIAVSGTANTQTEGVAAAHGQLYFGDHQFFYSYTMGGLERWRTPIDGRVVGTPAIYDAENDHQPDLVFTTAEGSVYSLRGSTGQIRWRYRCLGTVSSLWSSQNYAASPALADLNGDGIQDVIVGCLSGQVAALNGHTGGELWTYECGTGIEAAPLIRQHAGQTEIYIAESHRRIHFLGPDGRLRHLVTLGVPISDAQENPQLPPPASLYASPLLSPSGELIIGTATGNGKDGLWVLPTQGPLTQRISLRDYRQGNRQFFVSPAIEEHFFASAEILSTAFVADVLGTGSMLYGALSTDGHLLLYDRKTRQVTRLQLPAPAYTTPLVVDLDGDGRPELLVALANGQLHCYQTPAKAVPWFGYLRGDARTNSGQQP